MDKTKLKNLIGKGKIVLFDTKKECAKFIEQISKAGGRWLNGKKINKDDYDVDKMAFYFGLSVDEDLQIAFVSTNYLKQNAVDTIRFSSY